MGVWIACLLLAAGPARAEVSEGTTISAQYKGTVSTSYNVPPLGGGLEEDHSTAMLKWDANTSFTFGGAETIFWKLNELTGSVHDTGKEGGGNPRNSLGHVQPQSRISRLRPGDLSAR